MATFMLTINHFNEYNESILSPCHKEQELRMTPSSVNYVHVFYVSGATLALWPWNRLQSPGVTV